MTNAVVFPGQGSQSVGMLKELSEHEPLVRQTFDEATQALGYDLWQLVSGGPAEELNLTERTQPAMLAAGIASFRAYRAHGGQMPHIGAGHSLGEITALVAANAIGFSDGIRLTQLRGRLMQAAVPAPQGAMAAILMLDDAQVIDACATAAQGEVVEAVNFNCPGQVVIAGHSAAVERAMARCKELGAKRVLRLPVSVPAHSSLLREAGAQFRQHLDAIEIQPPQFKVCALNGLWHAEPNQIRQQLVEQLYSPVQWTKTIGRMTSVARIIECGPGKVLTGLNKKILAGSSVQAMALDDSASLAAAVSAA
jgi:[acyl-carrier-protein] S-malonyltransferase